MTKYAAVLSSSPKEGDCLVGLISSYIEHFTYLGLFVCLTLCGLGLPIPEDVALLVGGFLAYKGVTRYSITLIVAVLGVIAGDNTLYFVGRGLGSNLFPYFQSKRTGVEVQLNRLHAFMHRHGHLAIFYARFFPGIRALVYLFAGSVRVPPSRFFVYDLAGAAISVPVVVTLGWRFGEQLDKAIRFINVFNRLIWMAVALCVLALLARYLVLRYWYGGARGSHG